MSPFVPSSNNNHLPRPFPPRKNFPQIHLSAFGNQEKNKVEILPLVSRTFSLCPPLSMYPPSLTLTLHNTMQHTKSILELNTNHINT